MIYEFTDNKHGTAAEKRDKAVKWISEYFTMIYNKEQKGMFSFEDPDVFLSWLNIPSNSQKCKTGSFKAKMTIHPGSLEFEALDAKIYNNEQALYFVKIFAVVEGCCDMFERGKMK